MSFVLSLFLSNAMDALGKVQLTLNLNILEKFLISVGLILSINESIIVMLWVMVIAIILSFIIRSVIFSIINKISIVNILAKTVLFSSTTVLLLVAFSFLMPEHINVYLQILVSSGVFIICYYLMLSLLDILPIRIGDIKKIKQGIRNDK